ncbi:MAG TPA: hypothetical protein VGK48_09365 [Terriglobia bacterium]|jgi:uncharacterized protein (DUF983 family)
MKLGSLLRLRCPICGKGELFQGYFDSPVRCPKCGYFFMRETGYFLPHVPIGYAFTVAASLGSWPLLRYVFGIRNAALTLTIMVAIAILFGIWFVRYSKALWLAIDLKLHPPNTEDFESRGRPG